MMAKKEPDAEFMYRVSGYFKKHKLYATSTTGQMIEDVANLKIHKLLCRPFWRYAANGI